LLTERGSLCPKATRPQEDQLLEIRRRYGLDEKVGTKGKWK
jgi:hypothetical protein